MPDNSVISSKRAALVIGNSDYRFMPGLPNAERDARSMAALLKRLGFTTVKLFSDLTSRRLCQVIEDFTPHAAGAEVAVIYFAGHGFEPDWGQYILPIDTSWGPARSPPAGDKPVRVDTLLESLQAAGLMRMIILDCCRNPVRNGALSRSNAASSTVIAYATGHGSVAYDGAERHSPYTAALLKHLPVAGLELDQILRRVRQQVIADTDGHQEPFVYAAMCPRKFFFA